MKLAAVLAAALGALAAHAAPAGDDVFGTPGRGLDIGFADFGDGCAGDCALQLFGGRQTTVAMTSAFGIGNPFSGHFGFVPLIPIWDWPWGDTALLGVALSHDLVSIGIGPLDGAVRIDGELGIAQRLGGQTETELWAALYLRWTKFPWNRFVPTTIGLSTGLNWASGISDFERAESGNGEGSQLLHYLSPEITFGLPGRPDVELVARFHHRSGGGDFFGPGSIFNNTESGTHFQTVGLRFRF